MEAKLKNQHRISPDRLKECPYCFKSLSESAIRCRYCRNILDTFDINKRKKPLAVKTIGMLLLLVGIGSLLVSYITIRRDVTTISMQEYMLSAKIFYAILWFLFGVVNIIVARGLFLLLEWARELCLYVFVFFAANTMISIAAVVLSIGRYMNFLNIIYLLKHLASGILWVMVYLIMAKTVLDPEIAKYFRGKPIRDIIGRKRGERML